MEKTPITKHHSHSGKRRKIKRLLALLVLALAAFLIWNFFSSGTSVFNYAFSSNPLKQTDDRVNILLLGIAGGNHDGALLTDSIIVASYQLKTHQVTLISIPRDVWIPDLNQKVNAAYEIGKSNGRGLAFTEDKIDDILGIPIHYAIRLDFSAFTKAIDQIGGVDVNVPRAFDDYEYPIEGKENDLCGNVEKEIDLNPDQAKALNLNPGKNKLLVDPTGKPATESAQFACRFEHPSLHFDQGLTHLDGVTALKFVRSRKGTNNEGSDFARSRRQQIVIQAFREKALSLKILSNPKTVTDLLSTFGSSVETDIPAAKMFEFYNLSKKVASVDSVVLGDLGNGKSLFVNPPPSDYGGAWVLVPQNNDFSQVKLFLKQELEKQATSSAKEK